MYKFKMGDRVVAKRYADYASTLTEMYNSYVPAMRDLAAAQEVMTIERVGTGYRDRGVRAGDFIWQPEDLEYADLKLENE